jgi:hypothetical protein
MVLLKLRTKRFFFAFLCAGLIFISAPGAHAQGSLHIEGDKVLVETHTLKAVLDKGTLISLIRKADGKEFIDPGQVDTLALKLVYAGDEAVSLGEAPNDLVTCLQINEHRADIRLESWYGDAVISVEYDPLTGDLLIEPSGYASRPGLRACRWVVSGLNPELELVVPFYQGIQLPIEDPLIQNQRWGWPNRWEAGLAILLGDNGGFWVHCQDDRYRYKSLKVGCDEYPRSLGFDTEPYGPLDDKLGTGNLVWRINVFEGTWEVPAARYSEWFEEAYDLKNVQRPEWVGDLKLALSWCPNNIEMITALAKKVDPQHVLLHASHWRKDKYDQNYPTFKASEEGAEFIREAQKLGFHVMPHANSIDMDPLHPTYHTIRDFQYRSLESKQVEGWAYKNKRFPVPESNAARLRYRDYNTMVKVHPGLSMWRSILIENIMEAAEELDLELIFIDVTLNTRNLHNAIVENMSSTEGMKKLTAQLANSGKGLLVGGEGRNEITIQDQFIGQAHLFRSGHQNIPGIERVKALPLNEFMFGKWCRSMGYANIGGKSEEQNMRMKMHLTQGAIPTITVRSVEDIENPNKMVAEFLKMAASE